MQKHPIRILTYKIRIELIDAQSHRRGTSKAVNAVRQVSLYPFEWANIH